MEKHARNHVFIFESRLESPVSKGFRCTGLFLKIMGTILLKIHVTLIFFKYLYIKIMTHAYYF